MSDLNKCPNGPKEPPYPRCKLIEGHEGPCDWSPEAPVTAPPATLDFEAAFIAQGGYKGSVFELTLQRQHQAVVAGLRTEITRLKAQVAERDTILARYRAIFAEAGIV